MNQFHSELAKSLVYNAHFSLTHQDNPVRNLKYVDYAVNIFET